MVKKKSKLINVLIFSLALILLAWLVIAAAGDGEVVAPASNSNHSQEALFNVSYVNGTDFTVNQTINVTSLNASFYYNLSGTWTLIGNSSECSINACWGTLNTSGLTDGFYSINATIFSIFNQSTNITILNASNLTTAVGFDSTPPIVNTANITTLVAGSNYSGNGLYLNVSVVDVTINKTDKVIFNITNATGGHNATYTGVANVSSTYTFLINTTSFPDGNYSLIIQANDTLNNYNDSAKINIFFDNTVPQIMAANITAPAQGSNYSQNTTFNVTITDLTTGSGGAFFNFTNSSGTQNGTFFASREGSTDRFSLSLNTTNFPDGNYSVIVHGNDSAGNSNNTARIVDVTFDNTAPAITHSCSPTSVETGQVITCTCSALDTFSGVTSTSFTVNPDTSSDGTFTTTCTASDSAGNDGTDNIEYTVTSSTAGPTSSGGGGGGGSTSSWVTYPVADELIEEGHNRKLAKNQRVRFTVDEEVHYVGVKSLVSRERATIEVTSTPQTAELSIGESKRFEVTNDSLYDLRVTLNNVTISRANITILAISEPVPQAATADDEPALAPETVEEPRLQPDESPSSSTGTIWIVVILILIALGVVVWFIVKRKQEQKKQ